MKWTHIVAVTAAVLLGASAAAAEVQTREIEYKEGEAVLQGLIAWDDASKGLRPGVLVVHEWWGHNEHARYQARRLAEAGYVGCALDMYGKGKVSGGGLPPSPVIGDVEVPSNPSDPNGPTSVVPFVIGGFNSANSSLGPSKVPLIVDPTRRRTFWYTNKAR